MQPTRQHHFMPPEAIFAVALELSNASWKIAMNDGKHANATIHTVSAEGASQRLDQLTAEIEKIRTKWNVDDQVRTTVLYEAGQDGFWIYRALMKLDGYDVHICDPSSIPVARAARRAKTDRLDAILLLETLLAWLRGERHRMRVIHVPSAADEEQRHLLRERGILQKESMQHRDRILKLLRTVGCWHGVEGDIGATLASGQLRCYDGSPLPPALLTRLQRECDRIAVLEEQFAAIETGLIGELKPASQERVAHLRKLKGVGPVGAARLVAELFWRRFENRRQVGACVGLVPQPYDSGQSRVDQGISKQGNRRVRSLCIEMAWMWIRYQPNSAISRWYLHRIGPTAKNKRNKRITIVGVARRLVIALWRYLEHGVLPDGAELKRVSGTAMSQGWSLG
jgi:transposase